MKKTLKTKILSTILLLCLLLSFAAFTACSAEPKPHIYIAIGDSVPSGYGLFSPEESYPAIFYELLKSEGYVDDYINMAESGATTTRLLEILHAMDGENLHLFRQARIVTLNIGGNNILAPFLAYINALTEKLESDVNRIKDSGDWSGVWDIASGAVDFGFTFFGWFSDELKSELENGVRTFSVEFKEIIDWIEKNAPKATIIVNKVYNPIPPEMKIVDIPILDIPVYFPLDISEKANELIESINAAILRENEKAGYLILDSDTLLASLTYNSDRLNINLDLFSDDFSVDIHPNAEGHKLMAQSSYESFVQYEKK